MRKFIWLLAPFALACGNESAPTLVGQIDPDVQALRAASPKSSDYFEDRYGDSRVKIKINGRNRDVFIDANGGFNMEVPEGEFTFTVFTDDVEGSITLRDVQPWERIEVSVKLKASEITIKVKRRERRPPPGRGGDIVIQGHDQVHHLPGGVVEGDLIIHGDRVTVYGEDCDRGEPTLLEGNLIIHGHDTVIKGIRVLGYTDVRGDRVKLYERCD